MKLEDLKDQVKFDSSGPNKVFRTQTQSLNFFMRFKDFLDSTNDSEENEVLFVKIIGRVLDLCLDMSSEPKWLKYSFLTPDLKVKKFFEIS